MNSVLGAFLLTFAGLFPIVNPLEAAPFFLGLTAGMPTAERRALARKAATNGFALLLGSMLLGPWLLEFFGIELPVLRIAGGLVVTALGWKLLTQEEWSDHGSADLRRDGARKVGSFYPLTMPLTVGPGSMSVAITIRSPANCRPGTARDRRAGGTRRDRRNDLPRLPVCGDHSAAAGRDGPRSAGAAVRVHSHVHRH